MEIGEQERALVAHFLRLPVLHTKVSVDLFGDIDLVGDQQVGFGDARAAFAGDLDAGGEVDHLQGWSGSSGLKEAAFQVVDGHQGHGGISRMAVFWQPPAYTPRIRSVARAQEEVGDSSGVNVVSDCSDDTVIKWDMGLGAIDTSMLLAGIKPQLSHTKKQPRVLYRTGFLVCG